VLVAILAGAQWLIVHSPHRSTPARPKVTAVTREVMHQGPRLGFPSVPQGDPFLPVSTKQSQTVIFGLG